MTRGAAGLVLNPRGYDVIPEFATLVLNEREEGRVEVGEETVQTEPVSVVGVGETVL